MSNTDKNILLDDIDSLCANRVASDGRWFMFPLPDGRDSGQKLLIFGRDSDAFASASLESARALKSIEQIKDEGEKREAFKQANIRTTAALVGGWTFAKHFSTEAMVDVLRRNSYLISYIDNTALEREVFYAGVSSNSPGTPNQTTGSESQQSKGQSEP